MFEERPNISNKVVVLTGAAAGGIGFHTSVRLAELGATVIIGVRGEARAKQTAKDIAAAANVPEGKVIGLDLDLSSFEQTRKFAEAVLARSQRIDILINNAGVMMCPYQLTADGLEMQMGTNHFGHFYLTKLLLPTLLKSKARLINVSSNGHCLSSGPEGIDYEHMSKKETYDKIKAYGNSKLANVYHARELHRRYGDQGLKAYSLHPGGIMTNLQRHNPIVFAVAKPIGLLCFKTVVQGAQTTLFCALSDEAVPGGFHADCKHVESNISRDPNNQAANWWDYSETVVPRS